jgi:hypothetical protein
MHNTLIPSVLRFFEIIKQNWEEALERAQIFDLVEIKDYSKVYISLNTTEL